MQGVRTTRISWHRVGRDAYLIAAALWLLACLTGFIPGGGDAHAYWVNRLPDPYTIRSYAAADGFYYSPAFAQLMYLPTAVPWHLFLTAWTALILAALYWMVGPWALPVMLFLPIPLEIYFANVNLLFAAVIIAGFRYPAVWALPLLTKVTPGIGVLWFAFRGEWRSFGTAIGATAAIVAVSWLLAPGLWTDWGSLLLSNETAPATGAIEIGPLSVRLVVAIALLFWASRTDRAWVVPIVVLLASPRIWTASLSVLVAVPVLYYRPPALTRPHALFVHLRLPTRAARPRDDGHRPNAPADPDVLIGAAVVGLLHRPRYAGPPPSTRSAGGRPCLLRRRRAPQRRPAALHPARDDRRPRLLPLSAAAGDRVPAAGAPAVRDRRAHLGGVPDRAVRGDARPPRTPQPVDMDRDRLAGRADRLEPGHRPGAGRGHVPGRARISVGDRAGREPEDPAGHRRGLLDRPAGLARASASGRLAGRPGRRCQFVLEPAGTIAFIRFSDLGQVGNIENRSLYAISPILWAVFVVGLLALALRFAPNAGWLGARGLGVGPVSPRLLHVPALDAAGRSSAS